jgi:hypothetical protein
MTILSEGGHAIEVFANSKCALSGEMSANGCLQEIQGQPQWPE